MIEALRKGLPELDPEAKMFIHMLLTRCAESLPDDQRAGAHTGVLGTIAATSLQVWPAQCVS